MLGRLFAAATLAATFGFGTAQAAFPDRDIIFLIPFSPGGGMDSTARQLAKIMPKFMPGNVNVVPKNVPGAGGRKGYGQLARAKPDGYTICVFNMPGAAIPHLTGQKVSYDITKIAWVGRMSTSPYLLGVAGRSSIKTLGDIKKLGRPLKVATTGYGSTAYTAASITKFVVGFPIQFLTGYKGSADYILGVVRGDADAGLAPTQTFAKFVKSGDIHAVVTFEEVSSFPGVPTIAEAGFPQLTDLGVERLVGAPPGTPASVIKILSDALGKAAADKDSMAWAAKTKRPFSHLAADRTAAAVKRSLDTFGEFPDALKKQD